MKITRFDPKGIHLAEVRGFKEFQDELPKDWFSFSNFVMRIPMSRAVREIDLAIVTHDRIILVDLKDWKGYIENRENYWFQNGERRERSAVLKIEENAKKLAELLRHEPNLSEIPWVEGFVVFTHPEGNFSGLSDLDKQRCLPLKQFLKLAKKSYYDEFFQQKRYYNYKNPLNGNRSGLALDRFFKPGRYFEPHEVTFASYRPIGSPNFQHPKEIYEEYFCELEDDHNHTALLRIWDFSKLSAEFSSEDVRCSVAEREHAVLGYIGVQAPELYEQGVLIPQQRENTFSMRFWELFHARRSLERAANYINAHAEALHLDHRIDLVSLFLSRIAELHRIKVAHRDLDSHSVWIEPSSRIILSRFSAAHYPERKTIGEKRVKLLAAGARLPEDAGLASLPATPFQQDVFLAAVVCWKLLTGEELLGDEDIPIWQKGNMRPDLNLPEDLEPWFERCLATEPPERFTDGIAAFDAFSKAVTRYKKIDLSSNLVRYTLDIDLLFDYPCTQPLKKGPPRVYISGEGNSTILVKHWPDSMLGNRRDPASTASLLTFLSIAEELQVRPPLWTPKIKTAGLCTDGLILIQHYIDAPDLEKADLTSWDATTATHFIRHLLKAVEDLHERRMMHGDLKPANILVVDRHEGPEPILIDFPEFSPPEAGQCMTMAYCPEMGAEDPVQRDQFAVHKIIVEIYERIGGTGSDNLARRLLDVTTAQLSNEVASRTLLPLRTVLEQTDKETSPNIQIAVGFPQCHEDTEFLPDNGTFHIRVDAKERMLYIVGMDQQLQIALDPAFGQITSARVKPASTASVSYASRKAVLSFNGSISIYQALRPEARGLQELTNRPEIAQALGRATISEIPGILEPKIAVNEVTQPTSTTRSELGNFQVERFWRAIISAESDLLPEVRVIEQPKIDGKLLLVPCEENEIAKLDFGSDEIVYALSQGKAVGKLDTAGSSSGLIVLREVKRPTSITPGRLLQFQSRDNRSSFQRRERAVSRILTGASEVPDLLQYFDPAMDIQPCQLSKPPSETTLKRYGFNEQQEAAFRHLWVHGPVGLLQGPPGTGKTKFISSFIHYALTEGGMRNVLLLSQSHEAVNNAAEKVLECTREFGNQIDLLRVGQQGKVSTPLLAYHSDLVQERYRELFRAEMKSRLALVGKQLGLPAAYVAEAFEVEATIGQLVRQILSHEMEQQQNNSEADIEITERKLRTLRESYEAHLQARGVEPGFEPMEVMDSLYRHLRKAHSVQDINSVERLRRAYQLAEDWVAALGVRQRNLEEFLARSRNLVCGTCVGIGRPGLQIENTAFDLVVIDEAARCNPGELAVGMQSGRRILLVGDHKQLPPLYDLDLVDEICHRLRIASPVVVKKSDFERAFLSPYGQRIGQTLKTQYRMAPKIGELISDCFYHREGLVTGRANPSVYYNYLPFPFDQELLWIDTSKLNKSAYESKANTSYRNRVEADIVIDLLKQIANSQKFIQELKANLPKDELPIGVICMYSAQRSLVRERIVATVWPDNFDPQELVKVDTVDGYQGKQNPIIILSLVRSNSQGKIGHVKEENRINVALSRAMERLIIIGNGTTFNQRNHDKPLAGVWQRLKAAGRVYSNHSFNQEN